VSDRPDDRERVPNDQERAVPQRRRYEKPKLIEYGHVAKLTQTGGLTTKDMGSMKRAGP
jgi:hypothetical protein